MSMKGWLTKPYHVALAAYGLGPWLFRNRLAVTMPRVTSFLSDLRLDDATKDLPIGVAGFCWGGQHTIRLCWYAPEPSPATTAPLNTLIDAAFVAHPSAISVPADIEKVTKPLCIAAGDQDHITPVQNMRRAEDILTTNGIQHELEIYQGADHGWSVRADRKNPRLREQAEECERQAVRWFTQRFANEGKERSAQ
jgi:dienelactone hydrolase